MSTPTEGRALGLDLGTKRIGVAVTDDARTVATPLEVIDRADRQRAFRKIADLVDEWEIAVVVVGLPLHLKGTKGASARFVDDEIVALGATISVPIVTYDERLSTVSAHRSLDELNIAERDRRSIVDMLAASVILQGWIDSEREDSNADD